MSIQACWTLWPLGVLPTASIVVISRLPTFATGRTQERRARPSTCTVQAPHWAIPQPNFVPVSPTTSRNTHKSGMSSGTLTSCVWPLIRKVAMVLFTLPSTWDDARTSPFWRAGPAQRQLILDFLQILHDLLATAVRYYERLRCRAIET